MERLIGVLGDKLDLTTGEIADILWLGLLQWQSRSEVSTQAVDVEPLVEDEQSLGGVSSKRDGNLNSSGPPNPAPTSSMVGLQPQKSGSDVKDSDGLGVGNLSIALPDAPGLRDTLGLLRALKPLLRKVPSIDSNVLDEAVTAQRIAETDLWIPELQPELEPWLDLALVIDASPSMLIWQRSLRDVQRLLRQCGAFRDIRVWSLDVSSDGDVQLRPGYGSMAAQASPCSPRELIDPNGRRLVLVMSDCIDDRWQTKAISAALAIWARHGMVALVQVLPEWLWDRTALQSVPKVRFYSLEPGTANHKLRVKRRDRWRRSSIPDIKVPVLTLEPSVAQRWSQMVAGKGDAGAAGLVLARSPQTIGTRPSLPPQEQVKQFHLFSSPIARRLASLLSACPIVTLPIIRMVQDAMLADSDQVHVAEVLWGGLFQPIARIENFANPDEVEYKLQDAETRKILLGETPPADTFEILSRWINQRLGKSLDEFVAVLQDPQQSKELGNQAQAFAGVTIDVLRRQGGAYTRIAERLAAQWSGEPDPEPGSQWSLNTLDILEFTTAQLAQADAEPGFPTLQTEEVEVVTIAFGDEPGELQLIEFEVATLQQRSGFFQNLFRRGEQRGQWVIHKQRRQAYQYVEPLGGNLQLEMVSIPAGRFLMGSPEDEPERRDDEGPQHEVTVSTFFMGRYPVTQAQWRFVAALPEVNRELNREPSRVKGDKHPVEQVSWYDAVEFCNRLSAHTGRACRLPSEVEWEYACRAGTTTPFHFGKTITTDLANYGGSYTYNDGPKGRNRSQTTPVDEFGVANAFGLCDMHGNVWEWCADHWHNNYEGAPTDGSAWLSENKNSSLLLRGGSWNNYPRLCRSAYRNFRSPEFAFSDFGFRVVCSALGAL
jgi:formylglycine-generating enzyme required for sulfatase activity